MTVGNMRRLMLKKVIPEKVIPQNIVDFLVDDSTFELAEPDTYTFLTRLRELGVGSADFVYLLEGCGAPAEAVERIKANPAMNLQTLILTLETSGMTSKHYMRILFTARQIWEKTLSTRLEKIDETQSQSDGVVYKIRIEDEENAPLNDIEDNDVGDSDDDFSAALQSLTEETEKVLREQVQAMEEAVEARKAEQSAKAVAVTVEAAEVDENSSPDAEDNTEVARNNSDNWDEQSFESETEGFYVGGTEEFESLLGNSIPEDYAQPVKPTIEDEDFDTFEDFAFEEQSAYENDEGDSPEEVEQDAEEDAPESAEEYDTETSDDISPVSESDFVKDKKHFTVQIDYSELQSAQDEQAANEEKPPMPEDSVDMQLPLTENGADESFFDVQEYDDTPAFAVTDEEKPSSYNGDTTAIIAIDRAMLEENLANIANLSDIARSIGEDNSEELSKKTEEKSEEKSEGKSDDQTKNSDNKPEKFEVHIADIDDEYNEDYDYVNSRSRYYGGALTAAAVGAVIVTGCAVISGIAFGMTPPDPIDYAADANEVFTEIYYSYEKKISGGDSFYGYSHQNVDIFGDLLVTQEGLGTFTEGDHVYTVTTKEIAVNKFADGALEFVGTLCAPTDAEIVDVVTLEDNSLCAVLNGDTCGYMRVSGGTVTHTVRQDGKLTDFAVSDGEICVGSLYTPKFYQKVTALDVEMYLPKLGTEYTPMPATSVIPSRTNGYSYGISAAYSAISGETLRADAVLGNPVYASADGQFALNGAETGLLIKVDYSKLATVVTPSASSTVETSTGVASGQTAQTAEPSETDETTQPQRPEVITADVGKLSGIAFFGGGSAALESGQVILRDKEFTAVTVLENFSSIPDKLMFRGNRLLVADKEKVFFAMDCTSIVAPQPITLRQATGRAGKHAAVTVEQTAEGIKIADYTLGADGVAVLNKSSLVELNGEKRGTLKIADSSCIVVDGDIHGAAYCYFDGVSVIWEYTAFAPNEQSAKSAMLYDDKTGITLAFPMDGKLYAQCANGLIEIT